MEAIRVSYDIQREKIQEIMSQKTTKYEIEVETEKEGGNGM